MQIGKLAQQANVCGLSLRDTLPIEARTLIARADEEKRPLSTDELKHVCDCCGSSEYAIKLLVHYSPILINKARANLLKKQPHLINPGGELYPEHRAQACWRDCEHFMRVITYGVGCNCAEITDKTGMIALVELYQLLHVPVHALLYVLSELKTLTIKKLKKSGHDQEISCLDRAFNDLITALQPTQA